MLTTRRRAALGLSAAAAAAALFLSAAPAQAVALPAWPATGRIPTGCATTNWSPSTATTWSYGFTDTANPVITGVHIGTGAATTSVVTPAGSTLVTKLFVSQTCSGVGIVFLAEARNGSIITDTGATPATVDAFAATYSISQVVHPTDVGAYNVVAARAVRRYDAFTLDQDFKLTASTASVSPGSIQAGPWVGQKFYVLRATTLSNALSATKLKKGKTVKATAQLKMATNAGYVADAGAKVAVQTKVGTGKWVTKATLTANASGIVTYSFVLSATTQVRFIHNKVLSGNFTNGVVSAIKTVTRI